MKKAIKILAVCAISACALITTASAATLGGGKVTASSLNFRAEASTDSSILACVSCDSPVIITEKVNDEWYEVLYNGTKGYMNSAYIEFSASLDFEAVCGRISGNGVRLRKDASYEADTITYLYNGERINVTGVSGEWYKVIYKDYTGYVYSDYVTIPEKASGTSSSCSIGQSIVDWAMEFLGTGYVYGGSSPSGFDCSGFTYYLFNNSGYKISRTASSQWYDGEEVSKDELQVGDLVFFSSDTSNDIEHVGIYIGDGQFIHSSSSGGRVRINSIYDYYYSNNWYGAVRVF